jgi:hypothetical protein
VPCLGNFGNGAVGGGVGEPRAPSREEEDGKRVEYSGVNSMGGQGVCGSPARGAWW